MQFEKDYSAIISYAWDLDTMLDNHINDREGADNGELLHLLGIDENAESEKELKINRLLNSDLTKGSWKERFVDPFGHWVEN